MPLNPVGNWYQQFLPNIGGRHIVDITFTDSLNGYALTSLPSLTDTAYILRTTNSGDNWSINHRDSGFVFNRIKFINNNTGFAIGTHLTKTIDGGSSWNIVSSFIYFNDMAVLSNDTIFAVKSESLTGGVYRSTNGGTSWQQQLNLGSSNPNKIYMYNQRIGFIAKDGFYLRKTTDSGQTWNLLSGASGFTDIYFTDSLTGIKSNLDMKKTTDGGLTWSNQVIPSGGIILDNSLTKFTHKGLDTIWAAGGTAFYGAGQFRGIIYRTINGGSNWQFQIPDTSIHSSTYFNIDFYNKNNGWAYWTSSGVHTTTGGDPIWLTGIEQISSEIPTEYRLYQNYPNPFNPVTNIKYSVTSNVKGQMSNVKLSIYDITGKEIIVLVNQEQNAGTYVVDFDGSKYSSGVYFYTLIADGINTDTKKMIMLK